MKVEDWRTTYIGRCLTIATPTEYLDPFCTNGEQRRRNEKQGRGAQHSSTPDIPTGQSERSAGHKIDSRSMGVADLRNFEDERC
jgi:hypothetical protein